MAEARRMESWNHTSAIWYGLRLLMHLGYGGRENEMPDPMEIHPYVTGPQISDQQRAAAKVAAAALTQNIARARAEYAADPAAYELKLKAASEATDVVE